MNCKIYIIPIIIFASLMKISAQNSTCEAEAVIILPGNYTFFIPECEESILAIFSVQLYDPCSKQNFPPEFFFDGDPITPSFINNTEPNYAYYEFSEQLTRSNNNDLLLVTYTDTSGESYANDALFVVNSVPDPPVKPVCLSEITIGLDINCIAVYDKCQFILGKIGCYSLDSFNLVVYDSTPGNDTIDGPGSYRYEASLPAEDFYCEGVVHARGLGTNFNCNDIDNDTIPDYLDNCPTIANNDQADTNGNGIGDACETSSGNDLSSIVSEDGDVIVDNSSRGVILRAPNGDCYRITINNDGSLNRAKIQCPSG